MWNVREVMQVMPVDAIVFAIASKLQLTDIKKIEGVNDSEDSEGLD